MRYSREWMTHCVLQSGRVPPGAIQRAAPPENWRRGRALTALRLRRRAAKPGRGAGATQGSRLRQHFADARARMERAPGRAADADATTAYVMCLVQSA